MLRHRWLLVVSSVIVVGSIGRIVLNPIISQGADRRIASEEFFQAEEELGLKLYAPTWLPNGGHVGASGTVRGAKRILQDYADDQERSLLIVAQEPRSDERDNYNRGVFVTRARARATVKGKPAYFINGSNGERRLFWNETETAVIISSMMLTDRDLLAIAEKVR